MIPIWSRSRRLHYSTMTKQRGNWYGNSILSCSSSCGRIVHNAPRKKTFCQMIFIKMFQNLPQFSGTVPLEHWLARIAINTCLNQIAAEKARPELRRADLSEEQAAVLDNLATSSDELAPGQQLASRDLVLQLLEGLKPAERLVISLLYLEEKSVDEISKLTGWSTALVKVRAFRARRKLKEQMARLQRKESHE